MGIFLCCVVALAFFFLAMSHLLSTLVGQRLRHALRLKVPEHLWEWLPSILRPAWMSNIPGSPYAWDDVTIAAVAPFPECNDHNAILPALPLPAVISGLAPEAKYWSCQAFVKGASCELILCDRELTLGPDGRYEIVLGSQAAVATAMAAGRPAPANHIDTGDAAQCMFGIRAFMVPNGRGWHAPDVRTLAGVGKRAQDSAPWPVANQARFAGPVATELASRTSPTVMAVAAAVIAAALSPSLAPTLAVGALGALGLRSLLLGLLAKKYYKLAVLSRGATFNQSVNKPAASHALKGSARHVYFSMPYDAREADLQVSGVLALPNLPAGALPQPADVPFRYTSVTCYSFDSLPLKQYLDASSIVPDRASPDRFTATLTCTPRGLPNEIDVSEAPRGICCLRLVYPQSDEVVAAATPTIAPVAAPPCPQFNSPAGSKWGKFFVLAGLSNIFQALLHFATLGGAITSASLLGFSPNIPHAILSAVSPALARALPINDGLAEYHDAAVWLAVGLSGFAYMQHGLHGTLHPLVVAVFAALKYEVAISTLLVYWRGTPGAATLPICLLESTLGTVFLIWALFVATCPAGAGTVVRLRNFWLVLNALAERFSLCPFKHQRLVEAHEALLELEKKAFGDSAAATAAKRALFEIQAEGVSAEGNRFTAVGRLLLSGEVAKRLERRRRFAQLLIDEPSAWEQAGRPVVSPIIIAGLPRTGSTMLHRLLAADPLTRSPLWWEQMHDDADATPPKPDELLTDRRIGPVARAFKKLALISPNALAEFYKFHRMQATDVEECAPFMRRYFWDMEGAYMAPSALAKRQAWIESTQVDRSFLAKELRAWLALHGPPTGSPMRWVLKAPLFTPFLPELAAAFPGATFVFTSRDPIQLLPSTCGMAEAAAAISMSYDAGLAPLGGAVASRMASYAAAQLTFCKAPPPSVTQPPLVFKYMEVIADPMATVRRIYAASGRELTPAAEEAMKAHLAVETQHREGRPDYSLAKFGLRKEELERQFAAYRALLI